MSATGSHSFLLAEFGRRGQELLARGRTIVADATPEDVRALAARIPSALAENDTPRVVFCGQYSAGKSSLITAMTGRSDIQIGAGITTNEVQTYTWNGVEILDTPGIHTRLRPDHDEASYAAIAAADLLVFIISNELMDETIAANFRKLAVERDKGHEMMLVVNKMSRAQQGNTLAAHAVITEALRKVLAPFTPEGMRLCFTDAQMAIESRKEQDPQTAEEDWADSGMGAFLNTCDTFVREKGLAGRFTTALYELEQVLQEALAKASTGDKAQDGLKELLIQKRRTLNEGRLRVRQAGRTQITSSTGKVRDEGRKTADLVHGGADSAAVNQAIAVAQQRVDHYAEELEKGLTRAFGDVVQDLEKDLEHIADSELAHLLKPHLAAALDAAAARVKIDPATGDKARKAAQASSKLGEFLVSHSFNGAKSTLGGIFRLRQYSGTNVHAFIKSSGKLFGKSFKPWQAVKWTKTVSNIGRVLSVAGTVISVLLQVKEDSDAENQRKELAQARDAIRSSFGEAADVIETHYDKATDSFVSDVIAPEIQEVDRQVTELNATEDRASKLQIALSEALEETQRLIREIHASAG